MHQPFKSCPVPGAEAESEWRQMAEVNVILLSKLHFVYLISDNLIHFLFLLHPRNISAISGSKASRMVFVSRHLCSVGRDKISMRDIGSPMAHSTAKKSGPTVIAI